MKKTVAVLFLASLFSACVETDGSFSSTFPAGEVEAWVPVYATEADMEIEITDPRPIASTGKIYVFGTYLYVIDQGQGVHIINNLEPANPRKQSFLKVLGAGDVAVKGEALYVNRFEDIMVFDISDPANPTLSITLENAFAFENQQTGFPPEANVYFVCPEQGRPILKWEKEIVTDPKCYYQ